MSKSSPSPSPQCCEEGHCSQQVWNVRPSRKGSGAQGICTWSWLSSISWLSIDFLWLSCSWYLHLKIIIIDIDILLYQLYYGYHAPGWLSLSLISWLSWPSIDIMIVMLQVLGPGDFHQKYHQDLTISRWSRLSWWLSCSRSLHLVMITIKMTWLTSSKKYWPSRILGSQD